ncbi:BCCT family transporter [Arcticibacterium luteifluviistationis]|uniref:BCCT transporter n=1 Tax=Arcticibacterium luteifluviistationis TaxID=1784714 RepID=A0A2Z4G879_9BACT|nr:BCCT family transporter [Arcticibacterium luteifluviistationis]AWV97391.1 BCCT transporter [Arcticibacterium luteifluviistationis]
MNLNKKSLNRPVFYPPLITLILTVIYGIYSPTEFLDTVKSANSWILTHFGWLFTWSSFLFLILILAVYFSPLGKTKFGGADAKPSLNKWTWFAIAICTTTASALIFWACAEPLYHLNTPPDGLNLIKGSKEAAAFSMSTLFMHWSFTPYGIYTVAGLAFAHSYYNLKQPFSVGSMLYPIFKDRAHGKLSHAADIICLYALILGMSASLGGGMLAISGGLETNFSIENSSNLRLIACVVIVVTFIISSATGLTRGIRFFSNVNISIFIALAILVFILGPTKEILMSALAGTKDYLINFLPRSLDIKSGINNEWYNDWTIFYLANWFAWAPITSLFLGRLAVGYTVRQFINFNLLFPSLFTIIWMSIFGGTTLHFDILGNGELFEYMSQFGEGNAMYAMFSKIPFGGIMSLFALAMLFIAFITAADSNVSAMSALSSKDINPTNPEAPIWIKITWGILIGTVSFIMLTYAGIDGIRILSVLGGFPSMFLIVIAALGLLRLLILKK